MGAKSPSKTHHVALICRRRLPPLPRRSSSLFDFLPFSLVLSHGSDLEADSWSAAPPLPRLAVETGAPR